MLRARLKLWLWALALAVGMLVSAPEGRAEPAGGFRGFHFNPQPVPGQAHTAWLRDYHVHRDAVNAELRELVEKTGINLIDFMVLIPRTLTDGKAPPKDDAESISEWANMKMMANLVAFLDYCHALGIQAEVDLATNMWIPYSVDTKNHIANGPWWPVPDETPWTESIVWYTQIIEYVEELVVDKEVIALWDMMGSYQFGGSEPALWNMPTRPEVNRYSELFVKKVWPGFVAAGERPKGAPIALPIFSNNESWRQRPPLDRLSAFTNLKRWLVDDLGLPPDFWVFTNYTNCDPASDGFHYLRAIVNILGPDNASKIIATDFKGPGHHLSESIIDRAGMTGPEMLQWHFDKVAAHGFAGWWVWTYRDTAAEQKGIRQLDGTWRAELVDKVRAQKN